MARGRGGRRAEWREGVGREGWMERGCGEGGLDGERVWGGRAGWREGVGREDHWENGNREGRMGKSSKYEGRDGEREGGKRAGWREIGTIIIQKTRTRM